jgi:putative ABC transport system permease protein
MLHATIRSLLAHKLRFALTAISVVLGVAFIAGTLVLTDTLGRTFDNLFGDVQKGTAVEVRATAAFDTQNGAGTTEREPVPATVLAIVQKVDGVRSAVGNVSGQAVLVDSSGKAVRNGGAPALGVAWSTDPQLSSLTLQSGHAPAAAAEIAIDAVTAKDHGFVVGDRVKVLTKGPVLDQTLVGIFRFGTSGNLAGATLTAFDTATAQQVIGEPDTYSSVSVAAAAGVSQPELTQRVRGVLPAGLEAISGKQFAAESSNSFKQALSIINTFLLVFAGIALFVGSFIIYNTFAMLVAQRTREFALLRALGASRRQVTGSLLGEALAVGFVGATVGLGLGVLVALGLRSLLGAFGITLPGGPIAFLPHTVVWSYAVGIGVTTVAALAPARRAATIPPMAAMRDDVALPERSLHRRAVIGVVLTAAGGVLLGLGLAGAAPQPATTVGLGAVAVFLGVATLTPFISGPVIRVLGAPFPRLFGVAGKLGRDNAVRNPRRTSATASALMIGLALVSAMTVLASSLSKSLDKVIGNSIGADLIITNDAGGGGFTPQVAAQLRNTSGVAAVTSFRAGQARFGVEIKPAVVYGVQADTVDQTLNLIPVQGSIGSLAAGKLLVDEKKAKDSHWQLGQSVPVEFAKTGRTTMTVGGTYRVNPIAGSYLISTETYEHNFTSQLDSVVAVKSATAVPAATTAAAVKQVVDGFPGTTVRDQTEYKAQQRQQVQQLLGLVSALLLLAILIAAFGIVNTLALSVVERTREIGLLRAVGMGRGAVREMIVLESLVISVFGALLGAVVGVVFGWALVQALRSQGLDQLAIPVSSLVLYIALAGVVGIVAALWPARRAARLNVLQAVTTE